jgi:hypothetical protein
VKLGSLTTFANARRAARVTLRHVSRSWITGSRSLFLRTARFLLWSRAISTKPARRLSDLNPLAALLSDLSYLRRKRVAPYLPMKELRQDEKPHIRRGSRLLGRLETLRINDLLDLGAA